MTETITPPPLAPEPAATSLTSRLTNVFVAPGEVFAEIKTIPVNHAHWWVPALLFAMASWVTAALMFSQPAIRQQLADMQGTAIQQKFQSQVDSGKMTQAQVDKIKDQAAQYAGIGQIVGGFVVPVVQAAITPFWGGFLLWVGGTLIFRQRFEFMKAVEVVGLTMVVLAIGAIVKGLLCVATGKMFVTPGPILFIGDYDPNSALHAGLLVLDVFVIWGLFLRAVGMAKLASISIAKAAAWVLGVWILITGSLLALSLAAQKLFSSMSGNH